MTVNRIIDAIDVSRKIEIADAIILPVLAANSPKAELGDFECSILRDIYEYKRPKISNIRMPRFSICPTDSLLDEFMIEYIGILSKMAKFFKKKEYGFALYRLLNTGNIKMKYDSIRTCVSAVYETKDKGKDFRNLSYEAGLVIIRKSVKLLRTFHRKKPKFFRKLMIEDLINLYKERKDMVPEEIAEHWYFKRYVERLK